MISTAGVRGRFPTFPIKSLHDALQSSQWHACHQCQNNPEPLSAFPFPSSSLNLINTSNMCKTVLGKFILDEKCIGWPLDIITFSDKLFRGKILWIQADCLVSCDFTVHQSSRKTGFSVLLICWHLSGCIFVRPHWGIEGLMSLTHTHS